MDNEGKNIVGTVLVIVASVISIPWSIAWYYTTTVKTAIEAGYEQRSVQGEQGVYWVKVNGAGNAKSQ